MVGAILCEGAATATAVEAVAHAPSRQHEEHGRGAGCPALCRDDGADLLLDLGIGQADARIGIRAAALRERIGIDDGAAEARGVGDIPGPVVILGVAGVHVACLAAVVRDVGKEPINQGRVIGVDRVRRLT